MVRISKRVITKFVKAAQACAEEGFVPTKEDGVPANPMEAFSLSKSQRKALKERGLL